MAWSVEDRYVARDFVRCLVRYRMSMRNENGGVFWSTYVEESAETMLWNVRKEFRGMR